ncbi:unnamed protein product [Ectocarpus sp. CCAP 1310/34]|nr:unnamed protein product [Ectocarpus sp. CCAP 1310/34]
MAPSSTSTSSTSSTSTSTSSRSGSSRRRYLPWGRGCTTSRPPTTTRRRRHGTSCRRLHSLAAAVCAAAVVHALCLCRSTATAALAAAAGAPLGRPAGFPAAASISAGARGTMEARQHSRTEGYLAREEEAGALKEEGATGGDAARASAWADLDKFEHGATPDGANAAATAADTVTEEGSTSRVASGEDWVPVPSPRRMEMVPVPTSSTETNPGGGGQVFPEDDDPVRVSDDVGEEADEAMEEAEAEQARDVMLITISIVVGCGVLTLILLCVVRKVMDLCLLRNDPTGSLRYSQEEGLTKRSIERLPETRYKRPVSGSAQKKGGKKTPAADGKKPDGTEAAAAGEEGGVTGSDLHGAPAGRTGAPQTAVVLAAEGGEREGARDSTEDMCAICLVEYETGDELRIIPGCGHRFHKECIDPWLETKAVCAYCKANVEARRTCCDRIYRSVSNRLGINLVAPTTIRFSSSRRTYTNEDVQLAMGPTLPASYGHSEMDYVGSAVAPRQASVDVEAGEGVEAEATTPITADAAPGQAFGGGGPARSGSTRSTRGAIVLPDQGGQPQEGSIVVQPASAPSYVVVPREYSLGGGIDNEHPGNGGEGPVGSSMRELTSSSARASATERPPDEVARATDATEEKEEIVAEAPEERRGSQKGFSDGRGGVVFGGNTEEFREAEAEAEAAAMAGARNGAAAIGGAGPRL